MARHLHQEAGGDPAQGPVRELANEPPSPRADEDFPDAPDERSAPSGGRGDLDADELDDFARRLGLTDDDTDDSDDDKRTDRNDTDRNDEHDRDDRDDREDRDDRTDRAGDRQTAPTRRIVTLVASAPRRPVRIVRRWRRPAGRVMLVLARRTATTASWMRTAGERLDRDDEHSD